MNPWSPRGLACALALAGTLAAPARAETEVDLALVLAVDVSLSMDPDEQALQRDGFVEAFRSRLVHDAIRDGGLGRIAVVYAEWAHAADQRVIVPWTIIEDPASAHAFADRLAAEPTRRAYWTSVSGAIDFSVELLASSGVEAVRRVVDVSGDGANNSGRPVTLARDEAVERGVTINGVPIMLKRGTGSWDVEDLDRYYRDCVIGGPGSFMMPVREREGFAETIRAKLIREIAGTSPPEPLIRFAQGEPPADCLAGEKRVRQRMDN